MVGAVVPRAWDWQRWGRATDLIHQSDLYGMIGKFGCLEQFKRKKIERATEGHRVYENASGKLCSGVAAHAVLHRILRSEPAVAAMRDPEQSFSRASIETAYLEEFNNERAGRHVEWRKDKPEKIHEETISMLLGVLDDMRNHVAEVVATEVGFVYELDGIWLTGACDLIYRAELGGGLCLGDWKTGKQKPHRIDLDHGWQAGIYAGAMRHAYFVRFDRVRELARDGEKHRDTLERLCGEIAFAWDSAKTIEAEYEKARGEHDEGEESEELDELASLLNDAHAELDRVLERTSAERFDEYPTRIRYVHLRDYVPYSRKTKRRVSEPEDLAWCGLEAPDTVEFQKGDQRGPAWLHVQRSEADLPRLRHLLRAVVSWVRFGRFPAAPGEMCTRCRFREPCLLDGYKPIGDDKRRLEQITKSLDFDGFGGLDEL